MEKSSPSKKYFSSPQKATFLRKCAWPHNMRCPISFVFYDQPYLWQPPHRKPRSPPAGLCWGSLHTLHSRPAWAAAWWTWIWHPERQTSPAAGCRKLPRQVKEKATLWKASLRCFIRTISWHVRHLCTNIIATWSTTRAWLTHKWPGVSMGITMLDRRQDRTSLLSDVSLNINMGTL